MNHIERLTRYTANFVDELARRGITDVVISPGSRSTPLAMMFTEHPSIKEWVVIDERSAAFFALGIAKQSRRAVAIVCTSGTAAANYFPAVVEAYHSRVPLIVLTADRPHELRDIGAPQAIDQIKLFGGFVKWYHEMALPEASATMLTYARNRAAQAVHNAMEENQGPVHLNLPFREPLTPDFTLDHLWDPVGEKMTEQRITSFQGKKQLSEGAISLLLRRLKEYKKGVIVCGPQTDPEFKEAVTALAEQWQIPVLADPLSQVRCGSHGKSVVIEGYDAFLRHKEIRKRLIPDFILRFGAMPVSKPYLFYVQAHGDAAQFVVENETGYRDPAGNRTEFIYADAAGLCRDLLREGKELTFDSEWLQQWQWMNEVAQKHLWSGREERVTEGEAIRALVEATPDDSCIFAANSMPIRDVDTFLKTTDKKIEILANRGVNGIDGLLSTGMGAAVSGKPVTIVAGDLSFFHDMNGLFIAKRYQLNVTILLINNNGGGIFSFLPQATEAKHFEALFGTPLDIDFRHAVFMYGGKYASAQTESEVKQLLEESYKEEGLHVIEVRTNREENASWHRKKWNAVTAEILENWG